jgi:hypothetical protein
MKETRYVKIGKSEVTHILKMDKQLLCGRWNMSGWRSFGEEGLPVRGVRFCQRCKARQDHIYTRNRVQEILRMKKERET